MKPMAIQTVAAQRAKIARILHRAMRRRGIVVGSDIRLHAGHWWVRQGLIWIRSTDALSMEVQS